MNKNNNIKFSEIPEAILGQISGGSTSTSGFVAGGSNGAIFNVTQFVPVTNTVDIGFSVGGNSFSGVNYGGVAVKYNFL